MNILYMTPKLYKLEYGNGIYSDLCVRLKNRGHSLTVITTSHLPCRMYIDNDISVINVCIGQQYGVNYFKKGLSFLRMPGRIKKAIKKNLVNKRIDLVLFESPPVMFGDCVPYLKKRFNCKVYLMQKDIFPQNAIDLGILKKRGIKGLIYKYFKSKEKRLYRNVDKIGCMSQGNIDYLAKYNLDVKSKLEIFYNSILPRNALISNDKKIEIEAKYEIDSGKINFVYGGNLGKPQGLLNLIDGIKQLSAFSKAHFYIIGRGTEKNFVEETAKEISNLKFYEFMPHDDFNDFVACCDVGIVALDSRFTIPNYPSRILNYMDNCLAVIALTDVNTDFKNLIIKQAQCGLWSDASNISAFIDNVKKMCNNRIELKEMGNKGNEYLKQHFHVDTCADTIEKFMKE